MVFYAIYSLTWVSYNTPTAIMQDFVVQMKPFCYFCVSYAVVPKINDQIKTILKSICLLNVTLVLGCFVTGVVENVFFHVSYLGLVSMMSFLVYVLCSCDDFEKISKKDLYIAIIMLTIGLVSTRSKYYGEFVLALYLLFVYRPGIMKSLSLKHIVLLVITFALVLFVTWQKIDYYFISGGQDYQMFDEEMLASFARPVMYASMLVLLGMHPLFGSGLASFGTYASTTAVNYSGVYATIGIDNVWGLSEDFGAFTCDAFYPELAQFGIVGIILFVYLFVWMYRKISLYLYLSGKLLYIAGVVSIIVLLIESIASTSFTQGVGAMYMMILGCLVSKFKNITKEQEIEIRKMPYKESGALDYMIK